MRRAEQLFEESARRFGDLGDEHRRCWHRYLAGRLQELGDLERARALHEDNLARARVQSERRVEAQRATNWRG